MQLIFWLLKNGNICTTDFYFFCDVTVGVTVGTRSAAELAVLLVVLRPISTCITQTLNTAHGRAVACLPEYLQQISNGFCDALCSIVAFINRANCTICQHF